MGYQRNKKSMSGQNLQTNDKGKRLTDKTEKQIFLKILK